jgi:dTMP kinase
MAQESKGYGVVFSEWNSSPLVKDTTKLGKKKKMLTPATFSLIHATDFADRTERNILPLLKAGAVVLCDRYIYTAFARDVARDGPGMGSRALRICREAHRRVLLSRPAGNRHGAHQRPARLLQILRSGMDLGLSDDPNESFRLFQGRILEEYEKMIPEFGLTVIDATLPIEAQQHQSAANRKNQLDESGERIEGATVRQTYGKLTLPGMALRSGGQAHCDRRDRRRWPLDADSSAETVARRAGARGAGHRHDALDAWRVKAFKRAKEGNNLGRVTLSLFYATDFADRLENEIVPALRAGIRRAHRSLHLFADGARLGARLDPAWMRSIHQLCAEAGCRLLSAHRRR